MGRDFHIHSHPSRVQQWRHIAEIAAFICAAVWAIYVFIYQERIKPSTAPVEIQRTATVNHDTLLNGKELVTVHVGMKNIGSRPASPAALIVNVYGVHYLNHTGEHLESPLPDLTELNRTLLSDPPQLLFAYRNIWSSLGGSRHTSVDPGETDTRSFVFAVPTGRYDMLSLHTLLCYAAASDGRHWRKQSRRRADGSFWLVDIADVDYSGLTCVPRITSEYFAL